jgi:hypothetical protein
MVAMAQTAKMAQMVPQDLPERTGRMERTASMVPTDSMEQQGRTALTAKTESTAKTDPLALQE